MDAIELIQEIVWHIGGEAVELRCVKDALADGAALTSLGIRDADQEAVEAAHELCISWLKSGFTTVTAAYHDELSIE